MAISPDVVSVFHCRFECFDLLQRSGIRDVARKASSVTLTTGMVATQFRRRKPWPPSPAGASQFAPGSAGEVAVTLDPSVCHFGSTRLVSVYEG